MIIVIIIIVVVVVVVVVIVFSVVWILTFSPVIFFLMCRTRKFWAFPALQTTLKSTIYKEYKLDNNTSIVAFAGVNQTYFETVQCGAKFTTGNAL